MLLILFDRGCEKLIKIDLADDVCNFVLKFSKYDLITLESYWTLPFTNRL